MSDATAQKDDQGWTPENTLDPNIYSKHSLKKIDLFMNCFESDALSLLKRKIKARV